MSTWLTEDELRQRFGLLFEHNPSVVLAIDLEQRITDINPAGLRVAGYLHEEVIGRPVASFVPPSQRDLLRTMIDRAVAGETVTFRSDAYASDGRLIEFYSTVMPVVNQNIVTGTYALLEDLTERLRAERTVAAQHEELVDLEHGFRSLFERNPDGICLLSPEGVIIELNEAIEHLGGAKREDLLNRSFSTFLHGTDLARGWGFFRRALDGETVCYATKAFTLSGKELALDVTLFPKLAHGEVNGVYSIVQDTTQRNAAERKTAMQAQRVRDLYLLATTPEYTDAQVTSTLQTGCRLLGMESGAIVGPGSDSVEMRFDSLELLAGGDEPLLELARAVLDERAPLVTYYNEGEPQRYSSWIGTRLLSGGNLHGVLIFFSQTRRSSNFEDVDQDTLLLMAALVGAALERRRTRAHLRTLAYYDSLTGLPNRLFFQERVRDAMTDAAGNAQGVAVVTFDLDRFKDINDSLGHAMGDRLLQIVAHRLGTVAGDRGPVARLGGDEFAVLMLRCNDSASAANFATELLEAIELPYSIDDYEQHITATAGISIFPDDARDDQSLMKNADMALYEAKERGGGAVLVYDRALEVPLRTRLRLEQHLRRAVERKDFVLHYQPIFDVATERVASVEALVRWQDDERGLVYPDEFIPTAEISGLIVPLGRWITAQAVATLAEWRRSGLGPLDLAINISARQFHHPELCDELLGEFEKHGIPASALEVEITESMTLANVSHAMETVRRLKLGGAHISVDDFGTGHSSLNYLRRFDVDEIKIDRSFVAGIGHSLSDETIVKAILAMGHSLGLRIVAEGVETAAQFDFLRENRCDRVQGYYFSRPLDDAAMEALLTTRGTLALPG